MNRLLQLIPALTLTLFLFNTASCYCTLLTNQNNDISFHLYSSNEQSYFIVIEKSSQKLSLYRHDKGIKLVRRFNCATGENAGNKVFSGDSRTPEGVYFITEVYEDNKITVFGSRAFHLDYPNVFDAHSGHKGDGIFIHGTNKKLLPYSTNGCITLDNNDLDTLAPYLSINSVPVIIVEKLQRSIGNSTISLEKTDPRFIEILNLLNIYNIQSPQFSSSNIKTASFIKVGSQAVASIAYRVFDESSMEYMYKKRVYLAPSADKKWRPLHALHYQEIIPKILAVKPIKHNLKLVAQAAQHAKIPDKLQKGNDLLKFVEKWRRAWSSKDIDTYMSCYSPTFKNGRLDLDGWKKKKTRLNKKYRFIEVDIRNIVVEWTKTGANVSFFQSYRSDQYQTSGNKLLKIVHNNGRGWLIQKEVM